MTFAEQNLDAFIDLIKTQPALFNQEKIDNLEKLINKTPDDIEQLSNAIANWYQNHSRILDAQLNFLNKSLNVRSSEINSDIDKNTLLNAIKQSLAKVNKKNSRS
ncbi:MAG: hypothetical protein AAF316_06010 [Cyanobacteria bacterium P01_A01_bin.80]